MIFFTQYTRLFPSALLALVCGVVIAETPDINVSDAYVTALIPGQEVSAGYMTVSNLGEEDQVLLTFSSAAAQMVQLHETTMSNGMMSMDRVDELAIPSKSSVVLKPGGMHLMIMGVDRAAFDEEVVEMQLSFASGEVLNISMPVTKGF